MAAPMLDPIHLRTFVAITEVRSFSEAGRQLGLSQSSVSEHVKRLEQFAGQKLFERDTHSNALTEHGRAMLEFARSILETNARAKRHFGQSSKRRALRFGACEDLAIGWLGDIIRPFMEAHPDVDLDFTIALSNHLLTAFDEGRLDLVLCKRWPDGDRGRLVFSDRIVWTAATTEPVFRHDEAQLVLYPPPSITRFMALTALEKAAVPWRIACTSGDLNGLATATGIGLGMMAHASTLIPRGLAACEEDARLPPLGSVDFIQIERKAGDRKLLAELSQAIDRKAAGASRKY
ncbi:LysR family transcriptional regulator [Methylosinus sp. R-45379]|uniref:LysR family transcriptional regulator n=1 Tax=unclassified Methylosinus TaxID=2624500 RepID=UPI0004BBF8A7|nr:MULTISPECIES: LysR family transcriptional regulator [unclassified Methylosinus]OAI23743.1 LysR family transcriptional regulator [Methylosinus sp. R-45379]